LSLKVAARTNLVWAAAERWGAQLLAAVVFTVLARLLDKPVFGIVALANLYIGFVQIFVDQGIGVAIVQRKHLETSHLDTAFWINVGMALALAGATVALRHPAGVLLGSDEVSPVLGVLALSLPLWALTVVPSALLERELKFKVLATRSLTASAIGGVVGVTAAFLGLGVWTLVLQQLVGAALTVVLLWSTVKWRPRLRANRKAFADLASFSGSVMGNNILWFVSQRVDQGVIGRGLGVDALGTYSLAMRVVTLGLDAIAAPVARVALPLFSGIQDQSERLMRVFLRSTSLVCSVAFPAFLGLLLVAPDLIPLVFGAKWTAAIVATQILCVAGGVRVVQTFVHPTMMALGRAGAYMSLFALSAFASAAGCLLAAGHGIAAVAWAVVIASAITGLANFMVLSRLLHFSPTALVHAVSPIVAGCAVLALAVIGIDHALSGHVHALMKVVIQIGIGGLVYAASMAFLARELTAELWSTATYGIRSSRVPTSLTSR
jgi:O-antigen/teichoic acid export membrane protein